jgi:hypothetical protein
MSQDWLPAVEGEPAAPAPRKEPKLVEILAFGGVVVLWAAFAALLLLSPATIDGIWTWFRAQSLLVQLPLGLLFLPWLLGVWIWESTWPAALRGVLVLGAAWATIFAFLPGRSGT